MGGEITVRLLPFFDFLFLTAYLQPASVNVVYAGYIRLVNNYLENVYSLSSCLHDDVLTRIPVNYLERIVNVRFFHYSTMFSMVLGTAFFSLNACPLGHYYGRGRLPLMVTALFMLLMFSLNEREMLTSDSDWMHFAAFALFFCRYLSPEVLLQKTGDRKTARRLLWLPSFTILFLTGPYCAIYAPTAVLTELVIALRFRRDFRQSAARVLAVLLPLGLYLINRSPSIGERHSTTTDSIFTTMWARPLLLPRLFVRSFASEIIEQENAGQLPGFTFAGPGLLMLTLYTLAFRRTAELIEKERSLFPLCLITSDFLNHLLVTASRWVFLREDYGMGSHYALRYQVGMLRLLLILFLAARDSGGQGARQFTAVSLLVFYLGSLTTTAREIHMVSYRKENFLAMRTVTKNFETESDETLVRVLSYHDPIQIRKALFPLQCKSLNAFYEKKEWNRLVDNAYGLQAVQEASLKILKEIYRICKKYRISYALDFGTLFGTIRHGGLIPWDDDADIVMTQNQWEAFRKVTSQELCEGMCFLLSEGFQGGERFYDFTPRIICEYSRRRSPNAETAYYKERLNHLWVDIFILDRLPDGQAGAHTLFEQKALYTLAMGHRRTLDYEKYNLGRKSAVFLGSSAGKPVPMKKLFALQDKVARRANKKQTAEWYYSNYDPSYIDIHLPDAVAQERIQIRFEDYTLCIPKHYDKILTKIYGDYMQLPPEEERQPSHEDTGIQICGWENKYPDRYGLGI